MGCSQSSSETALSNIFPNCIMSGRLNLVTARLCIAYYQVVIAMPEVFAVPLPPQYFAIMHAFNFISFNWIHVVAHSECIGEYATRMTLQALWPLVTLLILVVVRSSITALGSSDDSASRLEAFQRGGLRALPYTLAALFAFVPGTSSFVFAPFACDTFKSSDAPLEFESYMHTDLAVRCDSSAQSYRHLEALAATFIAIWPVGVPVFFLALLYASRHAIIDHTPTSLSRAIAFLHSEYRSELWPWEVFELLRKLTLTGFLLLVPQDYSLLRLVLALVLSFGYVVLLQTARPYRQPSTFTWRLHPI